jgi:DNA-binding GntR family transcriptional regulator
MDNLDQIKLPRAEPMTSRIYDALRELIVTMALRPGEAMSEARFAERLGVSRTPVREVFRRLADEGFLRIVPQVGTFVAPIQLQVVYDSQFIRETLEDRTVRLAAERITKADEAALAENLERQSRAVDAADFRAFFTADEAFHAELIRISGRPAVWRVIKEVKAQLDRVRYLSLESEEWLKRIFGQHRVIAEHVIAHQPDRAEDAMRNHLRNIFAAIEWIAANNKEFFEKAAD